MDALFIHERLINLRNDILKSNMRYKQQVNCIIAINEAIYYLKDEIILEYKKFAENEAKK